MIFSLSDLELIRTHETVTNSDGIIAMNTKTKEPIIAMLGTNPGFAKISFANKNTEIDIQCHQGNIRLLAMNAEGTWLASASTKGTLIRIFETSTGMGVKELRRGSENADIQ